VIAGAFLTVLVCSCSSGNGGDRLPVYPVKGKVLFRGQPPVGAVVLFHPLSYTDERTGMPRGEVDENGEFEVSTYTTHDGAPAGDYAVTVTWYTNAREAEQDERHAEPSRGTERLGNRFSDPKTSPIRRTVKEGTNELELIELN
jgi:hypothetical protein